MATKELLVPLDQIDFENPIAEIDDIRDFNPQRHEMEQLSAIVYENLEDKICVGYLDVTDHEFWVRGHMPNLPLMPGVIMLEAVAQMCSYFVQKNDLFDSSIVGFGGVDGVRFRDVVLPGQRLILMAKLSKIRPGRMLTCDFQAVVGTKLVLDGSLKGIPLPVDQLKSLSNSESVAAENNSSNMAAN